MGQFFPEEHFIYSSSLAAIGKFTQASSKRVFTDGGYLEYELGHERGGGKFTAQKPIGVCYLIAYSSAPPRRDIFGLFAQLNSACI